jgi:ribosomal protein S18 acetylase RimI-like enzyme
MEIPPVITYRTDLAGITPPMLEGFFVGWPNPPSPATHLRLLAGSYAFVIAVDDEISRVVGYINAISDGVLAAFIPGLEVIPTYQRRGIGSELMRQLIAQLGDLYSIDLSCDEDVVSFYQRLGLHQGQGMYLRNFSNQSGRSSD